MKILKSVLLISAALTLTACERDSDVASRNISKAADMFEINRRIVFYNGITGAYILTLEGRCSLGNYDSARRMSVTCKTGPNAFKKHYLGLSDNVTFFAEQMEIAENLLARYRNTLKALSE